VPRIDWDSTQRNIGPPELATSVFLEYAQGTLRELQFLPAFAARQSRRGAHHRAHNKWTQLFFILMKCSLIATGCCSQFSGQHIGTNERETRTLT
jgi:hypothetical protein